MNTSIIEDLRRHHVDLAQPRLGSAVVYATDDFFADKARLIDPAPPVFIPGKYDDNGKWMDGWESRRRRTPGHDWCVIRLGAAGTIAGFEIDTRISPAIIRRTRKSNCAGRTRSIPSTAG